MANRILHRLKPRVNHLHDFYVFDVETRVDYNEWVKQRKEYHAKERLPEFIPPPEQPGIYWGLNARPESLVFGVIYGHNYSKTFYTVDEFKAIISEPRFKNKKIFAHNATYDLTTIYGNIFDHDPKALFIGSRFISCNTYNGAKGCFADSWNIFKTSVKTLGEMNGVKKPDLGDEFYSKEIGPAEINRCYVDCQIVYDALFQIFEFAGNIKITQASLSMNYFRAFHQPYDFEHSGLTHKFWASYYGGRTEVFKMGKTHSIVIDINSTYPKMMRDLTFPNPKFLKRESTVPIKRLIQLINNYEGAVTCTVKHPDTWIGFLPTKIGTKLCFPVGDLSGTWNFNELRFALKHGVKITSVGDLVYSEPMASPFVSYVDTLYTMRLTTLNEFEKYRVKIFMNSLYGKFAQRSNEETEYIKDLQAQYDTVKKYQAQNRLIKIVGFNSNRNDCFLVLKKTRNNLPSYSIPSFASYITSGARVVLLEKALSLAGNRITYMDTDSIAYEIDDGAPDDLKLGGWKRETKIITEINGLKNYKFIDVKKKDGKLINITGRRLKGVPEKALEVSPNSFEYYNLMNTKEALRRGKVPGVMTKRTKKVSSIYDKRVVLFNGETKPIEI